MDRGGSQCLVQGSDSGDLGSQGGPRSTDLGRALERGVGLCAPLTTLSWRVTGCISVAEGLSRDICLDFSPGNFQLSKVFFFIFKKQYLAVWGWKSFLPRLEGNFVVPRGEEKYMLGAGMALLLFPAAASLTFTFPFHF